MKFAPKVRHKQKIYFRKKKTFVRHILQTVRRIEKKWLEVYSIYDYIVRKSQFRYFDPFQRERQP